MNYGLALRIQCLLLHWCCCLTWLSYFLRFGVIKAFPDRVVTEFDPIHNTIMSCSTSEDDKYHTAATKCHKVDRVLILQADNLRQLAICIITHVCASSVLTVSSHSHPLSTQLMES